ncbi:MAG: DUF2608 domain-containing protein [Holosporales bacterium]|nr:DUF2608 domain-containing protein [Holosporales bacterium]
MIRSFIWWLLAIFNINIEVDNWHDVEKVVLERTNNLKEETLFCVDVDNVLTFTDHPCTYPHNIKEHFDFFKEKRIEKMLDTAWGKIFMGNPQAILDNYSISAIKNIQKLGGKVLGLTALVAGDNGEIIKKRNDNLDKIFGINTVHNVAFARTDAGVLCDRCITTDGEKPNGKAGILKVFMDSLDFKIKTIVFIDDSERNLNDVRKSLPKSYKYIAIHYVGYKKQIPQKVVTRQQFERFWEGMLPRS